MKLPHFMPKLVFTTDNYLDLLEYVLGLVWVVMERVLLASRDKTECLSMFLVNERLLFATLSNETR